MTQEEATRVAKELVNRMRGSALWSVTVSQTRGGKWRVVIHLADGSAALAIYSARLLDQPVAVAI